MPRLAASASLSKAHDILPLEAEHSNLSGLDRLRLIAMWLVEAEENLTDYGSPSISPHLLLLVPLLNLVPQVTASLCFMSFGLLKLFLKMHFIFNTILLQTYPVAHSPIWIVWDGRKNSFVRGEKPADLPP